MTDKKKKEILEMIERMRANGSHASADRIQRALDDIVHAEDPSAVAAAVRAYNSMTGLEQQQFFAENRKTLKSAVFRFANNAKVQLALRRA
jgi:ribosome maturation protein Sdo1